MFDVWYLIQTPKNLHTWRSYRAVRRRVGSWIVVSVTPVRSDLLVSRNPHSLADFGGMIVRVAETLRLLP